MGCNGAGAQPHHLTIKKPKVVVKVHVHKAKPAGKEMPKTEMKEEKKEKKKETMGEKKEKKKE